MQNWRYQRQCPYVLYDAETCRTSRDPGKVETTVASMSGSTMNIVSNGGRADGHFSGGYVSWASPQGHVEERMVLSHTGTALQLTFPFSEDPTGDAVVVYAGCKHTTTDCSTKFNNLINYGGMPYIPEKHPFGNNPIY